LHWNAIGDKFSIDHSGNVTASGSSSAPIFYDSNNTGYYVDPASTSNLYNLTLTGAKSTYLYINPGNGHEAMVRYDGGTGSGWYVGKRTANDLVGSDSFHTYSVYASRTVFGVDSAGNSISYASSRAPIFYDSAATSYFLNPNGASNLGGTNGTVLTVTKDSGVNNVGSLFQNQNGDNSWGIISEFRIANAVGTDRPSILFSTAYNSNTWSVGFGYTDDNFRIKMNHGHRNGGWGTEALVIDRSSNVTAIGSSRAPIFYDSNDTGYYVDANSESRLSTLRTGSHLCLGGFTNAAPSNLSTTGRITFGSLTTDAIDNYSIGTTLENYGGNFNKLDLAFHTGIRLGAHPNYGGVRFYADQTMASEIFAVGKSGNFVQAAHSMRAPIFYDSNDAAYYVDPSSTSNMAYISMPHRGNGTENIKVNNGQSENWRAINVAMGGGNNAGIGYGNNTRSVFNRHNLAFHCGVNDSIRFHSDGWTTLFEVTGGVGDAWLKGQLQAQTLHLAGPSNTNYSYPNVKSYGSSNSGGVANYHLKFMALNGNANGHISTNYYATTYSTTSDYRVKEDFQPIINATSRLMSLNPVNFQWKDSDIRTDGFLAHEVAEVVSDAVVGEKDAVDEQGNDELQALDQSKLVPLLVKTIQEQQGVIEALEARISALEALLSQKEINNGSNLHMGSDFPKD
jgi:hypothetical protein